MVVNVKVDIEVRQALKDLQETDGYKGLSQGDVILKLMDTSKQAKAKIAELNEQNESLANENMELEGTLEKQIGINEQLRNKDPQAEKERTKTTLQKNRLAHEVSENEKDRELKAAIAALEALRDERRNKWQTFRQVAKDIPVDELSKELLGNSGMTAVKAILGDTKEGAE